MEESRTKNSVNNFKFGALTQVLNTLINFAVRTVFIKMLGAEYLGVNGLFSNILTVLSFAELGIGNAIIYSMYKPVAEANNEKTKSLMKLYKETYIIIGLTVLGIGILIIPFLNFMIKNPPNISENLILIYLLFLINTSLSYFFTYKKSIISANQKEYIVNKYKLIFNIIKSILQIGFLIVTHNFIIYLIIQILCTFIENAFVSKKADKMYTYLKDENVQSIDKKEKNKIFKNVKALVMYKFGSVILNGTDNIIISKILGVVSVGILSNYTLIVNAVTSVLGNALAGFTASVGNLNATADKKQKESVFYDIMFITTWIYGFCSIALLILLNSFIKIWIGNSYLLQYSSVIAIVLHFYINGVQFAGYTYRTTAGLFIKGKNTPIIAAILNIILSILLGYKIGLTGILLATSISRLLTTTWFDPYIIHKYEFKSSPIKFLRNYIIYFITVVINFGVCYSITSFIGEGVVNFIIKSIIVVIVSNAIFIICFMRREEFKNILERVKILFNKNIKMSKE